jgi:hypothetical protein
MLTMHAADLNLILNLILRLFENTKFKFNENCLKLEIRFYENSGLENLV